MLKDIRDSRRVNTLIAESNDDKERQEAQHFPLQTYILSGEYWPEFHREQFKLPEALMPPFAQFTA